MSEIDELIAWILRNDQVKAIFLDGVRAQTQASFYDEVASKMHFPHYFGRNLNALKDCLTDEGVMIGQCFVIVIRNADSLLKCEDISKLEAVIDIFEIAAKEMSKPISDGELWDREAVPMHFIFQVDANDRGPLSRLRNLDETQWPIGM